MDEIQIIDNATPWLRNMAQNAPAWERKALKSAGWMMQKEIKAGMKSGAPGGRKYAETMPAAKRRKLENALGNKAKRNYPIMGKLVKAIGYKYRNDQTLHVGWLSASAANIGGKMEKGFQRNISDNMRRAFGAAKIPLSRGKNRIVIPARPTMGPMQTVLAPKVFPYIEQKFFEYAQKGINMR